MSWLCAKYAAYIEEMQRYKKAYSKLLLLWDFCFSLNVDEWAGLVMWLEMLWTVMPCAAVEKFKICSCPASCPCRLPESCNTDDITLNLLEEVEINFVEGSPDEVELFVKQLSKCNAPVLKKVAINYRARHDTLITMELCAKMHQYTKHPFLSLFLSPKHPGPFEQLLLDDDLVHGRAS
ncbi:hypothetical protein EJB05_11881, partial [Eragrostis curvula]